MDVIVIIPAYNRVATLGRAVESVLAQRYGAKAIILIFFFIISSSDRL